MARTPTAHLVLLLVPVGCGHPFTSECQSRPWVEVAPEEPTDLGYTVREAADHFTFVEDVVGTARDGSAASFHVEVVVTPRLSAYSEYVLATGLSGSITCPSGQLDVGDVDLHITTDDGGIDERLGGRLRVEQMLAMATAMAAAEVPATDLTGTWVPETADPYRGSHVAYFEVVLAGGELGAHVEHIEVGGVTNCGVKTGCDHVPEISFDVP